MYFKIYFDLEFEKEPDDNRPIPSLRIINLPALYDVRSSTSFQRHWHICIMGYYQAFQACSMWGHIGKLVSHPNSSFGRHLILFEWTFNVNSSFTILYTEIWQWKSGSLSNYESSLCWNIGSFKVKVVKKYFEISSSKLK